MKVKVQLFGHLEERVRKDHLSIEIENDTRVSDLFKKIKKQYPDLLDKNVRLAINNKYALKTDRISRDDTLALIPPVGGG